MHTRKQTWHLKIDSFSIILRVHDVILVFRKIKRKVLQETKYDNIFVFRENLECWIPEIGTVWTDEALAPVFSCTKKTVETFFGLFFHAASLSLGTLSTKKRITPCKINILNRNMEVWFRWFSFSNWVLFLASSRASFRVFLSNQFPPLRPFGTRPGDKNLWRSWNLLVLLLWHLVMRGHTCFELEDWLKTFLVGKATIN